MSKKFGGIFGSRKKNAMTTKRLTLNIMPDAAGKLPVTKEKRV